MCASQVDRAVEGHNRLARAGRAGHACGTAEATFDKIALVGVEEDGPGVPRRVERALQLLRAAHHHKVALGIGMGERVFSDDGFNARARCSTSRHFEQRLRDFARQMPEHIEQACLGHASHVVEPFRRHAIAEQLVVIDAVEWTPLLAGPGSGDDNVDVSRDLDLTHHLSHLDELRGAGLGVALQLPLLRPPIGGGVMVHVTEQQNCGGSVDDEADVEIDARGPEVRVLRAVEPVRTGAPDPSGSVAGRRPSSWRPSVRHRLTLRGWR